MKSYETVWEIFNLCANNQMRDVFIDEIETDDTDAYVRNKFKDKQITFEKTVLEKRNDYLRYQCLRDKREAFLYGNLDHSEGKTEQNRRKNMIEELMKCLEEQQVDAGLLKEIRKFRDRYPVARETANRIVPPLIPFFGKEIFEMAAYGLLEGENILLTGNQGHGEKCAGRESGLSVRTASVQYFLSCQYGTAAP